MPPESSTTESRLAIPSAIPPTPVTEDTRAAEDQHSAGLAEKLQTGWNLWKNFWFAPADPTMLCVIRILTAGMLLYNLCVWTLDFEAFFSHNGLQPLDTVRKLYTGSPVFSLWFYIPEDWLFFVHCVCVGIVFLFLTGTATRATSILSYLITISYSQRVPIANFGLDQILGLLCLYLMIGPCGARFSVDGRIRRWWNNARSAGITKAVPDASLKSSSARIALRLIQIHLCVIYFWAGLAKLKGDSWFTGEAMWNVIANLEYQTTDLTWMAHVPWLPYLVAHVTVMWELFFCVLVWNKSLRPLVLLIGTGMHFGIGAFLGMWTFGLAMTFCYFSFSNPEVWKRNWARWTSNRHRIQTPLEQPIPSQSPITENTANVNTTVSHIQGSQLDSAVRRRALPGTELLIVALRERHRCSLQTYFSSHDVPCRCVDSVEATVADSESPAAAILVMASELTAVQLRFLFRELERKSSAPVLAVVSDDLLADLQGIPSSVSFVKAPLSLKEIHEALIQTMWKEQGNPVGWSTIQRHSDT